MNDRFLKLIIEMGKFAAQQKQDGKLLPKLNQSESGVFFAILQITSEKPGADLFSLGELNSYLDYTRPNLSQTINKLEDKNYVERVILKDDRRMTYIRLTPDGKNMLRENYDAILNRMNIIKGILGEEDTERFIELAMKFIKAYNEVQ